MKSKLLKNSIKMSKYALYCIILQSSLYTMALSHGSEAQVRKLDEISIDIKFQNSSLENVFHEIHKKTEFTFAYLLGDLPKGKVTVQAGTRSLHDLLLVISEQTGVAFRRVNKTIHVKKAIRGNPPLEDIPQTVQVTISGKVTDENGDPLPGVNIHVQGTTIGTITDIHGNYSLAVPDDATMLIFSFIGFEPMEEPIGARTIVNVKMSPDVTSLSEVVVVGYGTQEKKDLTGAVSVIKPENLKTRQSTDIAGALKGMASGVKVTSSGQAGSGAAITIRGIGNLTNNNPLFVVDGLPTDGGLDLNIQDIASIQVLKDASSAAIYGSRAANGVIIITTKKGKEGPLKVDFNAQASLNWLPRYDLLDAEEYKKFNNIAYDEAIKYGIATKRQNHFEGHTDWQDEVLKTGIKQNYNVSLSGGTKKGNYFMSLNKLSDNGTLYGTSYKRYAFRLNTSGQRGIFSFGENLYLIKSETDDMYGNPFADLISIPPTIEVYDENHSGGFGYGDPDRANTYALNPIAQQDLWTRINKGTSIKGNVYGQITLFDALEAKLNFAYAGYSGYTNQLRKEGNWTMGQGTDNPWIGKDTRNTQTTIFENTYNYKKTFGKHDFDVLFGITNQHDYIETSWLNKLNPLVVNDNYYNALESATGTATGGGGIQEAVLFSYLGRINYSYNNKYLFSATMRRDGTSRLPEQKRWGNFPSVSAGWRISEESFFTVPIIDDLKIRANYGVLGNANIGYWDFIPLMNNAPGAVFGDPEYVAQGATQSKLVNQDLGWESKVQTNFGIDAAFLENKLTLTAEYFISEGKDLLIALPLLGTTGNNGGNPFVNAASLRNQGLEIDLGWQDNINDFKYKASINLTRIRNEVLDLGYGQTVYYTFLSKSEIGQPLGSFYLYKTLGIFNSQEEINNYTSAEDQIIQPNAVPGDIKYDDYNGDGIISSQDRQIVGDPWPKFEMGVNLNVQWHNFDLMIQGNGRFKYDVYNGSYATAADFSGNQNNFNRLNPWSPENQNTDQPRIVWGDTRNSRGDQDRWLEDGSYFRISEIYLGYTLPQNLSEKIHGDLKMGVTLVNMITFTDYNGLDPEFRDAGIFNVGVDNNSYPNPRSVLFSLSYGF